MILLFLSSFIDLDYAEKLTCELNRFENMYVYIYVKHTFITDERLTKTQCQFEIYLKMNSYITKFNNTNTQSPSCLKMHTKKKHRDE